MRAERNKAGLSEEIHLCHSSCTKVGALWVEKRWQGSCRGESTWKGLRGWHLNTDEAPRQLECRIPRMGNNDHKISRSEFRSVDSTCISKKVSWTF
jgi:hypothetical protein